jgi:hypothetical protein
MCIADIITNTKDVILAVGAIVAMYVAVRGLNTWNRQLKGGVEYELTRRLLKCTYHLREAIKLVRNPIMFNNEIPNPPADIAGEMTRDQKRYYGLSEAYQARWNKVTSARDGLQTELLEAEAIWGKVIYDQFEPLFSLQRELYSDVHSYLTVCNPAEHEDSKHAMSEIRRKRREVLYDTSSFEPDPFTDDVEKAITDIETFLKPHLKK